jgi:formiminotetrahydrofolate cyclodeaminase
VGAVKYSTLPLVDLLDAFSSSDPVPGGGSASALAGALGVSMLLMVAGMTKTRTGTPEEVADLAEAAARLRPIREQLIDLIDRDSDAYRQVVAAFKLTKTTDAEKADRREAIQAATRQATEIPLDTMRFCQQALQGAAVVARCGNANAQSDVGVGIELLRAALRGARMNIEINLPGLTDFAYVERVRGEVQALMLDADATAPPPPR